MTGQQAITPGQMTLVPLSEYGCNDNTIIGTGWTAVERTGSELLHAVFREKADANLYAASPDLLAACKAADSWATMPKEWKPSQRQIAEHCAMLRAAIDRAEGGGA